MEYICIKIFNGYKIMIIKCIRIAITNIFNQIINIKVRVKKNINQIKNPWYLIHFIQTRTMGLIATFGTVISKRNKDVKFCSKVGM